MQLPLDPRRTWFPFYGISLSVVTTFLLGIRLVSRIQERRVGLDDVFVTAGWVASTMSLGYALSALYQYGYDRKKVIPTLPLYEGEAKVAWILQVLFLWSMTFTKLSALMFYRRLVKETCSKRLIYSSWAAICVLVISTIILFFVFITICTPMEAYWRQVYPNYKQFTCRSQRSLLVTNEASAAINIITDVYSLAIPTLLVTRLRLTKRQRIAVMSILGIGSITIFSGVLRTWYLYLLTINPESSWIGFRLTVAAITETHVAVVCACAPSLRASFRRFFGDQTGTAGSRRNNKSEMRPRRNKALFPSLGLSVSADRKESETSFTYGRFPAKKSPSTSTVLSFDTVTIVHDEILSPLPSSFQRGAPRTAGYSINY